MATGAFPQVYRHSADFCGYISLSATPVQVESLGGLTATTGGVGSPTAQSLSGSNSGILRLTTDGTSGASWVEVNQNNVLSYGIGTGLSGSLGGARTVNVKVTPTGTDQSTTASFFGLSGTHNATLSSMPRIGFEVTAGQLYARTYDGTTDSTAVNTGIAVQNGVPMLLEVSVESPFDVRFYATNPKDGTIDRLCKQTIFTVPALAGTSMQICNRQGISAGNQVVTADIDVITIDGRRV